MKTWHNEVTAPKRAGSGAARACPPVAARRPGAGSGADGEDRGGPVHVQLADRDRHGIFAAAVLSAAWLRVGPRRFVRIFAATCYRMRWPLFTIACMLALAYVTRYSGMDATLGLAFTHTGRSIRFSPPCSAGWAWP